MASNKREPEFVEELAEKYKCSICTGILETPVLTECCGQHFCKECLEEWLTRHNTCPHCRAGEFVKMVDKPLSREIDELKVYCKNKENGCGEIVNYSDLEKHERGCCFETVTCNDIWHCKKKMLKKDLKYHLKNQCISRVVNCDLCNQEGPYYYINVSHYLECPELINPCDNRCGKRIKRKDEDSHKAVCPLAKVRCPFYEAGCKEELVRKHLENHVASNLQNHLSLTLTSHLGLKREHTELKQEHAKLQANNTALRVKYDTLLAAVSTELQSTNPVAANITKLIEPTLNALKPGGTITLPFSEIGHTFLGELQTVLEDVLYNTQSCVATPPFFIHGYPGCQIWITFPLSIVFEHMQPEAENLPIIISKLEFKLHQGTNTYAVFTDFLKWKQCVSNRGRRFKFSVHNLIGLALTDIRTLTIDIKVNRPHT